MPASFPIARAAALVLHVDVALILFPVCRSLISIMRRTILNKIVPFDDNISFHILIASAIGVFTVIHVLAHLANFVQITVRNGLGIKGFLLINFSTGPGWTGWIMLLIFGAMVWTSIEKRRRKNFERFWYTHHLMVLFFLFWALHGAFCMIASDYAAKCDNIQSGVLWKYWMYGALAYAIERAAREYRGRQPTMISKVIEHPSNVVEIQIKRPKTKTRAGQYIFLNCPEVSIYQYHPFTLTSAPEEDYISVHVRQVGDFTKALGKAVGCDKDDKSRGPPLKNRDSRVLNEDKSAVYAQTDFDQQLRRVLPKISIDGPFGSASEDVFQYEVSVLIGAGIGVTPFASILKSLWYRMNYPQQHAAGERALNRKVYFFWICRDFGSLEWFRSLLAAIEAADMNWGIEIHCYLTARITANDMANIAMNDVGQGIDGRDAITGLRTPTQFGRPNWEGIFRGLRRVHAGARAGVFFCGPGGLGKDLEERCKRFSGGLEGTRFVWGKENF